MNFRCARENINQNNNQAIFSFIFDKFIRWTGFKKPTQEEIYLERDTMMRPEYFDPIEDFPKRIDQLLDVINRVCLIH
jgi:hypothetical protein